MRTSSAVLRGKSPVSALLTLTELIEQDIRRWFEDFLTKPNAFYQHKFVPCPFAEKAIKQQTVDILVWEEGDVRTFVRKGAETMRDHPKLTTRVMVFPPHVQFQWGLSEFVESLNMELISTNVFLNTGVCQTTKSRYPGSKPNDPYFMIVANSLAAVLAGAKSLSKTDFYKDWPAEHYEIVVKRRARLARKFGIQPEKPQPT
jgi:hypothetical protein